MQALLIRNYSFHSPFGIYPRLLWILPSEEVAVERCRAVVYGVPIEETTVGRLLAYELAVRFTLDKQPKIK
jgi:hypothetical protein